ncbi:hypothetical protein LTR08_005665 [Meristemomyces frigidus]|nr:hypothetical protein LTR08_005665 [Meristemomyces frigidus]
MDVFVRNVPVHATKRQVVEYFKAPLAECGITVFNAEKFPARDLALLTVLDTVCGQRFLGTYGVPHGAPRHVRAAKPMQWDGKFVLCSRSRTAASDFSLQSLAYEASQRAAKAVSTTVQQPKGNPRITRFTIRSLAVGVWDYAGSRLAFSTHYSNALPGSITFGSTEAIVLIQDSNSGSDQHRIDLSYYMCDGIVLGSHDDPSISFTLRVAPRFYRVSGLDMLSAQLTAMTLGSSAAKSKTVNKDRLPYLDDRHSKIASTCFVYRVTLSDSNMLRKVRSLLGTKAKVQSALLFHTPILFPTESWGRSKERLDTELTDTGRFGSKPFSIRYQLDRLARNGALSPIKVVSLLPKVRQIHDQHGLDATLAALRRFYHQMPTPGPGTDAAEVTGQVLESMLEEYAKSYDSSSPEHPYELNKKHAHINLVHKVIVTPAGIYLEGPEPEPTNRVLRKYSDQMDKFVRVVFQDEDGAPVRYDPRSSQHLVYHQRFKNVLDGTILIAGYGFSFLGFSHSSLRSQSCWFMAPLVKGKVLKMAPQVIKELGDFSRIFTPARCAARIGQCFSDSSTSVILAPYEVGSLPVVERNGRDFSDGVGTISLDLLRAVWKVYGVRRLLKPTILQIRFQGAKGVVALDSRLQGRQLLLRSNMKKFEALSWDLEICGAGFSPLPMVLNRQFIKILEDLGVRTEVFMELQSEAVNRLRCMTTSAMNTATLMESIECTKATRVPSLIKLLDVIGFDYHRDSFLYGVVEMAVVSQLRDIKYRGRIPVQQGVTLYGIMDETGYLKEGEIYVATEAGPDGGRSDTPRANIIVTRSPAMHPGDLQLVNAVAVPANSPLKRLSNVIVFSQHGARDLPSQLSGGDLDGDIYNVIWDERLIPHRTYVPADYPKLSPVQLGRPVVAKDMSDFFLNFMQSDTLGMICSIHMQLADQQGNGTLSGECLTLAGMASTAVDYSKTGMPVDMKQIPRYDHCRPDFMSPSPRVVVSEQGYLDLEEEDDQSDDAIEGLDVERRTHRYYASQKALGHLYRAIDERQFLLTMQRQHNAAQAAVPSSSSLLEPFLKYMERWTGQYGVMFRHQLEFARQIKADYEESLVDLAYQYSPIVRSPLSEMEIFAGSILGRQGGAQGKQLRELSQTLRERYGKVVEYAIVRIKKGDRAIQEAEDLDDLYDDREFEALPRAIACMAMAVEERECADKRMGELKSFGYIAAVCSLEELQRYRITTFGSYTLPRV